jgi:hypothetical protein
MPLKIFFKLKKPQKLSLLGKYIKKCQKNQKNQKKTHWAGLKKKPGFILKRTGDGKISVLL